MSSTAVQDAAADLLDFYLRAYHLKDALIEERALPKRIVEAAINANPGLTLLADLANTDKHQILHQTPRSGDAPSFVGMAGSGGSEAPGWRLEVWIAHGDSRRSGVEVAVEAIEAWTRVLELNRLA